MKIRLDTAKNASVICSVDGRFLHSKYNPENEAKNFVAAIDCDYIPSCIILTGASLPYLTPLLHERYPSIPLYAIQYDSFFIEKEFTQTYEPYFNYNWTKSFLCQEGDSGIHFSEKLFTYIGEVELASALVLSWKVCDDVYSAESSIAWEGIRLALQKSRDVLVTRSFFSLRWLKNSINFFLYTKHTAELIKQDTPVCIIASGPSLKDALPYLKKVQEYAILIALSSALSTLVANDIIPDLCISTDGGFYAKNHLDVILRLKKRGYTIPLAVTPESNVPKKVLEEGLIIPLRYGDGIEELFFNTSNMPFVRAQRNGSVSGSAAILAMSLTKANVYAFGLDLAQGKGYSHALPNAHEQIHSSVDFKLSSLSYRLATQYIKSKSNPLSSLDIYRNWFETRDELFAARFYRVVPNNFKEKNELGLIKNISLSTWNNQIIKIPVEKKLVIKNTTMSRSYMKEFIISEIDKQAKNTSSEWLEHCALLESVSVKKYPNSFALRQKLHETLEKCFTSLKGLYS